MKRDFLMRRMSYNNTHKTIKYIILFQYLTLIFDKFSHVKYHGQYFLFAKYAEICMNRKLNVPMTRETSTAKHIININGTSQSNFSKQENIKWYIAPIEVESINSSEMTVLCSILQRGLFPPPPNAF